MRGTQGGGRGWRGDRVVAQPWIRCPLPTHTRFSRPPVRLAAWLLGSAGHAPLYGF